MFSLFFASYNNIKEITLIHPYFIPPKSHYGNSITPLPHKLHNTNTTIPSHYPYNLTHA